MQIKRLAPAGALLVWVSCGLIDPNITRFTFDLPARTYMFDANALGLPAGASPAVPCGDGQVVMDCCAPPPGFPAVNCGTTPLICQSGVCTAHMTVTQVQKMNLGQEVPGLADRPSFGTVSIAGITYKVLSNTLNVDSPPMEIFLAPDTVTDPKDAELFGTLLPIPAGSTEPGMVQLADRAEEIFARYAHDLTMPFNFIVRSTIDVPSGTPIPQGKIELSVTGKIAVSL